MAVFSPVGAVTVFGLDLSLGVLAGVTAVALLVLLSLSALFSAAEIALFSLSPHRLDELVEERRPRADAVAALREDPHRLLVTILAGNTLANLTMAAIAVGSLALVVDPLVAVVGGVLGVAALVLLFGESAPRSYAVEHTESLALRLARPIRLSEYALYPLVALFDWLTRVVNRLVGGGGAIETPYLTRDELEALIETGEREGVIDEDERELFQRVFRFTETIAKEVMTPRLDVTAIPAEASVAEAIDVAIQSGHERLPVYDANLDNVVGVVAVQDLVREHTYGERSDPVLRDLTTPTLHVPESKAVDELLREMRAERLHMVIVIDEFGTTEGIVTLEDIVEEVVGEILDGEEEQPIEVIREGEIVVRGEVNIDEVNDALEIDLPEGEEFETIAGFVFNRAGRLVEEGETFAYDGTDITVEEVENTRIMKARVERTRRAVSETVEEG
jgi:putative hemolysin